MTPPTLEQVRAYIEEKGYTTVDARFFWEYYESQDWHDKNDKPVKRWKGKLVQWHYANVRAKVPPLKCRICGGYGDYAARDDTGQSYRLCEKHEPRPKPALPAEMLDVLKPVPELSESDRNRKLNAERNRQMNELGVKP